MLDDSKVQPYVLLAKGARGRGLVEIITKATSEPGLFGFSELLAVPQIQEIANGEHAAHFHLLQLFAYGTWPDYAGAAAGALPELSPAQVNKLKQLTVVSLALQQKVLSYESLQSALQIGSVRALEDYLITECFYAEILKGKLDQKAGCVQVHDVVGRDVRPDQVPLLQQGFNTWLNAAELLLTSIEQRVTEAGVAAEVGRRRKEAAAQAADEMKKIVKSDLEMRSAEMMLDETNGLDFSMDDDRADRVGPHTGLAFGGGAPGDRPERPERRVASGVRSGKKRIQR